MGREKALVKNTFILSLGNFLPKLTTIITLPILTAYLSQTEYGTYDLLSTLIMLILPIFTLKIEAAVFRFLIECKDDIEKVEEIVSSMFFYLVPVSLILICGLYIWLPITSVYTKILICIYFLLDEFYICIQQIVRGFSKNLLYSISAIIYSVVNMLLIVVLVRNLLLGLNGLLESMIVAQLVAVLILFFPGKLYRLLSIKKVSFNKIKEMLRYSWPMIPNSLAFWVMNMSDRFIILAYLGIQANAIYAIANKIPNIFSTFQNTFIYAWQENASISIKDADVEEYYSKIFESLYTILCGLMALLIAVTPILFSILIKGDYQSAYYQMPLLFGGMLFSAVSSFLGGIYVAHMRTKNVGITTIISSALNIIINILLIKKIGLYAASLSTFLSFFLLAIYRIFDIRKFQPMIINWPKFIGLTCILIVMSILSYINIFLLNLVNFIIGIVFAFLTNKDLIISFLNQFKRKIFKNEK